MPKFPRNTDKCYWCEKIIDYGETFVNDGEHKYHVPCAGLVLGKLLSYAEQSVQRTGKSPLEKMMREQIGAAFSGPRR